jgi:hypothetical protein
MDFSIIIMKGAPTITTLQSCYYYISTSTCCFVLYEVDVVGFHFIGFWIQFKLIIKLHGII